MDARQDEDSQPNTLTQKQYNEVQVLKLVTVYQIVEHKNKLQTRVSY
jgi:hypothetical protein